MSINNYKVSKRIEYWLLVFIFLPIYFLWLKFGVTTFIIIFLGTLPSLLVTYKKKGLAKKVGIYSILTTVVMVPIIQYLAFVAHSWYVPSIVPRIFLSHSLEDYGSVFLIVYSIIALYEYFCEKERKLKFPKIFKRLMILSYIVFGIIISTYFALGKEIIIPYFYFFFICSGILITAIATYRHRSLWHKILIVSGIYIPMSFFAEYAALINNAWVFPGSQFIGYVSLFGITFPFEELIYILIQPAVIISAYELTADDGK